MLLKTDHPDFFPKNLNSRKSEKVRRTHNCKCCQTKQRTFTIIDYSKTEKYCRYLVSEVGDLVTALDESLGSLPVG